MAETNFMQPWMDFQKKMYDTWQNNVSLGNQIGGQKDTNIFAESIRPVQEALNRWVDLANNVYTQNLKQLNESYPQYNELVEKLTSGSQFSQDLNRLWQDLNSSLIGKDNDPYSFYTRWYEGYTNLVSKQLVDFLPEQVKALFGKSLDIYTLSNNTASDFFKPWLEKAQNMHNLLLKSMTGDQSAYIDFIRLWQDNFTSSFGKIFSIPQFSMNREQMQKQMSSINALITFINTLNEYIATMTKTSQETFKKILNDYQTMLFEGSNPKTYKEFYEYWWKQNEAAYLQLFSTPEFSKLFGQVLEAGVNFKKNYDDLLEKQLEFLPYPTKTDMDSVYKTLDTLKREIRTLKKELAALKDETSTAAKEN